MVTALKVSVTPALSRLASTRAEIGASVNTKASMVAMSGAIMPAPLAMPQMVTGLPSSRAIAAAPLGKVSVVMIALAASCQASARAPATRPPMTRGELARVERLADHAGRGEKHLGRLAPGGRGGDLRGERGRRAPGLAGEGIGVAGIDHERARRAALEAGAAPVDRRGRAFRAREHARDRGAGIEQREQHVGAPGVADAGGRGREPHAGNRRQVGKLRGRERRDAASSWGNRTSSGTLAVAVTLSCERIAPAHCRRIREPDG